MGNIYIFGHKKPDTDSVTSAIALSYLKNALGLKSKPMILGHINNETKFVLKHFNMDTPEYLEDVKLQIKDLNYYENCYVNELDSISKTYEYMSTKNITGVPLVNNQGILQGLLTSKMIGYELIKGDFTKINTSYNNIIEVLKAKEVLKYDEEISGNVIAVSCDSKTFLNESNLNNDTIMIVGDRNTLIEEAINKKVKLLVIIKNLEINEEYIEKAKNNKINIIVTPYDTFNTSKLIGLSNYVNNINIYDRNISFNENDYYADFKEKSMKLGYNNYPVIDDSRKCLGLVRITDINKKNKKQVILVDHNELNQSVEGLNEAEILEIIDHHKIGVLSTSMPINFRNMTVGSTNTIIYSMYNENNVIIPYDIAGIMLSGIISDTLKFTSPTTTEYDKYVAKRLSEIARIDIDKYSNEMFKAGTSLKGKTIYEIIEGDMKTYEMNNKKVFISQLITLNSEEILNKKQEYINKLNEIKINKSYDCVVLCVTDIIEDGSYIFYDEESSSLISEAFNIEQIYEGYFFDKCLSRKKQLVPLLMSVIK